MTQFEIFEGYWNEACNSTVYYLRSAGTVIDKRQLNEIWRKELLQNRFCCTGGLTHGAKRFLDELLDSEPEKGRQVLRLLKESCYDIGCDPKCVAAGAAVTAGSAFVSGCAGSLGRKGFGSAFLKGISLAAAAAGLTYTGKKVMDSTKDPVIAEFEKQSAEKLEAFRLVLS